MILWRRSFGIFKPRRTSSILSFNILATKIRLATLLTKGLYIVSPITTKMAGKPLEPLLLHAHVTGPNPLKVVIALEYLSLPYDLKFWELGDDPEKGVKGKAFLAINENGRLVRHPAWSSQMRSRIGCCHAGLEDR